MGRDLAQFVHPERISSQLICPICTLVLLNPVQTATDHLFCEDELLEWMTRSNMCPVTKTVLDPAQIRKPSRIILNMLAELEVRCSFYEEGCKWTGPQDLLQNHVDCCEFRPSKIVMKELQETKQRAMDLESKIERLMQDNSCLADRLSELIEENEDLRHRVVEYQHQVRVYEAFVPVASRGPAIMENSTDADRFRRLSQLETLQAEMLRKSKK